jgi:hypothetical protein
MPNEGKDFSTSGGEGLCLPPGYFTQYVSAPGPGPGAGKWILRCPGGAAVAEYAPGAATKGAVEAAAAEHRRANR